MYLKTAIFSVTLFALQHVVRIIYSLGYHLHFYQHYPGPCRQFPEIEFGSGNFYTLQDGTTFITSGLDMNVFSRRFQLHYTSQGVEGAIYVTNLNSSDAVLRKLDIVVDITAGERGFSLETFHPHGISVWYDALEDHHSLFVVNHPTRADDRIEKFLFDPASFTLHHVKSFTNTKLRSLHDVQAIGPDSFYATNILHEHHSRFFMLLELFSLMPWSSVVLHSPDSGYTEVVSGLMSATGIVMSKCGTLFVVNHPTRADDRIEKFLFDPASFTLHHVKSFTNTKLRSLHDVQAIGPDSFYATNTLHEQHSRFFMLLELFSLMPWSSVVLHSPDSGYTEVVSGLMSATGIVMSKCGTFIYVMLSLGSQILVYSRGEDNSLTLQQVFPLYTHPDSAVLDPITGDLFIGAHPIAHQYINHVDNPAKHKAASQVLHLRLTEGNVTSITELLYDDGTLISGSSAAVVYNNTLLVGSSVDKLVACTVNVPI
ncbi:hypothetical protein EGW08_017533 [Elysia chlorotica]|uniref:Arylesterase n=1 Tax=Elysia chlorotica TaxID=188477 RepID=A0A433SZG0_ELYCH|nr:hypothetical protein EGW08_017533 [Elysia chlorotica]